MFLSSQISFDEFKVLALPFVGIFIPLLIAYKIGKKTNLLVALLTIVLYSMLVFEFDEVIKGISEPLGGLLQEAAEVYFAPAISIFYGAICFIGLDGVAEPLVIFAGLWALFLILSIIGHFALPIKFINKTINRLLGLLVLVLLVLYVLSYKDSAAQALMLIK